MLLAAARAKGSLENARAVPRNMLRGNWSSTTMSASEASGVARQRSSSPRAARSQVARKRLRTSVSKISDFLNQALRDRPRSGESGAPNQKSRTSENPGASTESSYPGGAGSGVGSLTAEAEVGEVDQHRRVDVGAEGEQQDGGEHAQSDRRQELFHARHAQGRQTVWCGGYSSPGAAWRPFSPSGIPPPSR